MKYVFGASLIAVSCMLCAQEDERAQDVTRLSEAFGHLIGKNLDSIGVKFDIAHVVKGLQDASEGKTAPMTEAECVQAITAAQERAFVLQAEENLHKADSFLEKNKALEGVVSLDDGKVQYKIVHEGKGTVVEQHNAPLVRYEGRYVDGTVFTVSSEEEIISLDETIPGFSKGLLGMREGERRLVYIHPDFAYGTHGYMPPNSLLIFEIEVVKAHESLAEAPLPATIKTKSQNEIAHPESTPEHVR